MGHITCTSMGRVFGVMRRYITREGDLQVQTGKYFFLAL